MSEQQLEIQDILNELKAIIGAQAQEIAILKASIKQAVESAKQEDKVE